MLRIVPLASLFCCLGMIGANASAQESEWKIGLARVKITPQQPIFMAGYASRNKPFESVHDDLYAKAIVLEDAAGTRAALVTSDLIGFTAEISNPIRQRIAERTGIPATAVLINSSHTHTGPTVTLDPTPRENRSSADSERTVAYTKNLQDQVVQLVADAASKLQPAKLSWGVGVVHFVMNRREFTLDRGVILGVNPRGLADRGVPVLRIDGSDGKLLAVVCGAACHNTTLGGEIYDISGDYTGHAQRLIEEQHPGAQAMFVQGCAGDANPYPRGTHQMALDHGQELSSEVKRVLTTKLVPIRGPLRVAFGEVALPLAMPSKEQLEKSAAGKGSPAQVAKEILAKLSRGEKLPAEYTCPASVWQFGDDLTLVALSGEVVVDYVRLLEDALGPNRLWIAAYSYDVYGYLPSARVLREGGYETRGLYSGGTGLFAADAQDVLVAKVRELATAAGRKLP
jgi:Neutral/alkaline non-lysosomal ceramidase, N-terminal